MTLQDLESYRVIESPPLRGFFGDFEILTATAPTAGGPIILSILNTLEQYHYAPTNTLRDDELKAHRFVEALKYGYAERTEMCDPDFLDIYEQIAEIISKENAIRKVHNITNKTHSINWYGPKFDPGTTHGTTHLSVVHTSATFRSIQRHHVGRNHVDYKYYFWKQSYGCSHRHYHE